MRRKRSNGQRRLGEIERDVLSELTFGDLLYSMLASGRSTRRFYKLARDQANYRYRRRKAIERLIEEEYMRLQGERLSLTTKGTDSLGDVVQKTYNLLHNSTLWDGRWRFVPFDIPERYGYLRDKIRDILKRSGFVKLQHSIWIFPYDCADMAALLKADPKLNKYILYGVIERVEIDEKFKKMFKLR